MKLTITCTLALALALSGCAAPTFTGNGFEFHPAASKQEIADLESEVLIRADELGDAVSNLQDQIATGQTGIKANAAAIAANGAAIAAASSELSQTAKDASASAAKIREEAAAIREEAAARITAAQGSLEEKIKQDVADAEKRAEERAAQRAADSAWLTQLLEDWGIPVGAAGTAYIVASRRGRAKAAKAAESKPVATGTPNPGEQA